MSKRRRADGSRAGQQVYTYSGQLWRTVLFLMTSSSQWGHCGQTEVCGVPLLTWVGDCGGGGLQSQPAYETCWWRLSCWKDQRGSRIFIVWHFVKKHSIDFMSWWGYVGLTRIHSGKLHHSPAVGQTDRFTHLKPFTDLWQCCHLETGTWRPG